MGRNLKAERLPLRVGREAAASKRPQIKRIEALALNVQRVILVSSTSSGVTCKNGGLADREPTCKRLPGTGNGQMMFTEEVRG